MKSVVVARAQEWTLCIGAVGFRIHRLVKAKGLKEKLASYLDGLDGFTLVVGIN